MVPEALFRPIIIEIQQISHSCLPLGLFLRLTPNSESHRTSTRQFLWDKKEAKSLTRRQNNTSIDLSSILRESSFNDTHWRGLFLNHLTYTSTNLSIHFKYKKNWLRTTLKGAKQTYFRQHDNPAYRYPIDRYGIRLSSVADPFSSRINYKGHPINKSKRHECSDAWSFTSICFSVRERPCGWSRSRQSPLRWKQCWKQF